MAKSDMTKPFNKKGGYKMKKIISIMVIILFTVAFLHIGSNNASAMNNESAALLTAGIILFGIPVINAITHGAAYPEPVYSHAGPPRYIEKKVIYVQPKHKKHRRHWGRAYERGYRQEWKRQEYRRGMRDARRDYRGDNRRDYYYGY